MNRQGGGANLEGRSKEGQGTVECRFELWPASCPRLQFAVTDAIMTS